MLTLCWLLVAFVTDFQSQIAKVQSQVGAGGQVTFSVAAEDTTWAEKSPNLQVGGYPIRLKY